jgi:hypothetical protein
VTSPIEWTTRRPMQLIEFQLLWSYDPFLVLEKLKLSLISLVHPQASHAGNRGSKPLRGANLIKHLSSPTSTVSTIPASDRS